ncbi:MAG: carboxypeptidase regulatory-like domain-containing protein, partial [Planctomycetes bacterium]|nr:carboxypeptidase regulatory-like domain-containing protein [Planctomycetota bacterium]
KLDAPNENEAANAVVAHSEATERVALEDSAQLVAAPRAIDRERDLHGIVVDAVRRPVAGARVTVVQHAFAELEVLDLDPAQRASSHVRIAEQTTDEAGEFVIPLETGRSYDLVVEAAGFAPGSASHCHAGERIEITLDAGATLSGRVMRRLDNSPVVGATVELRYSRELHLKQTVEAVRVETDADGRYRFDNLPSGERLVGVFPLVDAPSGWIHATLAPGRAIEQDFRVEAGQRLRGRVVDRDTRAPIAGAVVGERWTMHRTVRTDARGEFEFPGLATSGYYEIGVRADGYGRIDQTVQAPGAETVGVVEVALLRGRTLRGRVIDRNGAPIEDAYVATPAVELDGLGTAQQLDWPSTRTRADGTYQLEDVRRDMQHSLFVQKAGYGVGSYEVDDRDVVNDVLTIPDVVLDAGAIVRGVVVDQDGEPYVARVVHLTGRNRDGSVWNERDPSQASRYIVDRSTRTDDLGRFAFADVAIGDYDLAAPPRGAEDDVRKRIAVDGPEPVTGVELVLPRGLSIAGRVIGPDGRGVHGWLVLEARDDPSRGLMQQYTEQDGTFEVRGLPAGVYSGVVYPTYLESVAVSERLARATIPEVAAGRKDVIVHAARAALIGGRVLDADGSAAVGVTVELWLDGERDGENGGVTAADGRFGVWVAENSGPYELRATGRIRQEGALQQVETFPPDRSASVRGVTPGDGRQHELRLP